MPPAFTSYILRGGRRGCRERIDVSCWEVNYSNSWLQGVPTIMNPSLLRGCQGKGSLQFSVGKGCTWGCDPLCCRRSWCHPRRVYLRCLEAKTCSGLGGMGIGEHVYLKYWHARGLPCIHNLCAPLHRVAVVLRLIFLMAAQRVSLLLQGYQEAVRSKKSTGVTCNPKSQVL